MPDLNLDKEDPDKLKLGMQPQFIEHNKYYTGAGGRLTASKQLGKNTDLQAYADLVASKMADQDASLKANKVGFTLTHNFSKGGKVSSASKRADGIARRGKTKGRYI